MTFLSEAAFILLGLTALQVGMYACVVDVRLWFSGRLDPAIEVESEVGKV